MILKYFLANLHIFLILLILLRQSIWKIVHIFRICLDPKFIRWRISWQWSLFWRAFQLIFIIIILFDWICIFKKSWIQFCSYFSETFPLTWFIWFFSEWCATYSSCGRLSTFFTYLSSTLNLIFYSLYPVIIIKIILLILIFFLI